MLLYRADDTHLKVRGPMKWKKCGLPWLGDEENFSALKQSFERIKIHLYRLKNYA